MARRQTGKLAGAAVLAIGMAAPAQADSTVVLARSGPVQLGSSATRVTFPGAVAEDIAARLKHLTGRKRLQLVMLNLTARQQPGVGFKVYLGPADAPSDEAHYVDSINFYNAVGLDGAAPKEPPSAVFDVTGLAGRLAQRLTAGSAIVVTLVPGGTVMEGSQPKIEAMELVEN